MSPDKLGPITHTERELISVCFLPSPEINYITGLVKSNNDMLHEPQPKLAAIMAGALDWFVDIHAKANKSAPLDPISCILSSDLEVALGKRLAYDNLD